MSATRRGSPPLPELLVVVGGGGVGKTTLAAAIAQALAAGGEEALVMTFDPSLRLKDVLGLTGSGGGDEERVVPRTGGRLRASLLDARRVFDRIVDAYAPDAAAAARIHANPYYRHLAGRLSGILEYMAVERLYEAAAESGRRRIVLDTPPAQQALDFLDAPRRIVDFLDSGALRLARREWFDAAGRLKATRGLRGVGRRVEAYLDRVVGLDLLRDMVEFFHAFEPLLAGFRERALAVEALLRSDRVGFLLVAPPGEHRVAATMHFARALSERDLTLSGLVINRIHPRTPPPEAQAPEGERLMHWLGEVDAAGLVALEERLPADLRRAALPLEARPPTDLDSLERLAERLARSWRRG
ncbi:MAG: ArsA-related P-loop ATPase [Thermoanaerobaculia bacterium]